jgi:hypothetical protein
MNLDFDDTDEWEAETIPAPTQAEQVRAVVYGVMVFLTILMVAAYLAYLISLVKP